MLLQIPVEELEEDLEALHAMRGAPLRDISWDSPGKRTHLDVALQQPQAGEQLLGLRRSGSARRPRSAGSTAAS